MKHLSSSLFIVVILLLAACNSGSGSENKARQLLEQGNLTQGIDGIGTEMAKAVKKSQQQSTYNPESPPVTEEQIKAAFAPDVLHASMQAYFVKHLTESDMDAALAWLNSPLGKKVVALDKKSIKTTDLDDAKIQAEIESNTKRIHLFEKLYNSTCVSSGSIDALLNFQKTLLLTMARIGNLPASNTDRMIANFSENFEAYHASSTITDMLFNYNTLSDEEINEYIAFANTAAGKNYHRALFGSLAEAINTALANLQKSAEPVVKK